MSERARILVVDDAPHSVRVIQDVLAAEGYQVIAAVNGAEAVEKARAEGPALILTGREAA